MPSNGFGAYRKAVAGSTVFLAAILAFSLSAGFGWFEYSDDQAYVINNPMLAMPLPEALSTALTHFYYADYIPATHLSYMADRLAFGAGPFGHHAGNLLLHGVAAVVLFLLFTRLGLGRFAFWAALLWAVHPLNAEPVAWISQRKTVLSGAAWVLSFLLYTRWSEKGDKGAYVGALAVFVVACLAKQLAVALPLVLLAHEYTLGKGRAALADKAPFFAVAVAVGLLTLRTQDAAGAIQVHHGGSVMYAILFAPRLLVEYVVSFFLPVGLSPVYRYHPEVFFSPFTILSWVALAVACVLAVTRYRQWPRFSLGTAWFVLCLLPVTGIVPIPVTRADRYMYLPAMGLCLIVGAGLVFAAGTIVRARMRVMGAGVVALLFLAVSWHNVVYYRDGLNYWDRAARTNPRYGDAWFEAGIQHLEAGDVDIALDCFRRNIEIAPLDARPCMEIGAIYLDGGRIDPAIEYLVMAAGRDPDDPHVWKNLAIAVAKAGGKPELVHTLVAVGEARREAPRKTPRGEVLDLKPLFRG
ncbi:MAG: hypothetical protein ACLFOY_08215 [Desulfatibacillaceae bacterium]